MKKGGITSLKVVVSTKPLPRPDEKETEDSCLYHCVCPPNTKRKCTDRRDIPGSTSFVPPVAGTLIAYPVAKDLMETKEAPENQREDNPFVKDKRPSAHNL
ncbi:MAG: hypothetical protein SO410_01595 [Candidatus Enterosoma sp.]|nr:hypothetical protein [Candidatus Enterosoma sp.]